MAGKKPTHVLKAKSDKVFGLPVIGVGWENEETGAIVLHLNPCVVLDWRDREAFDLQITLFPVGDREEK